MFIIRFRFSRHLFIPWFSCCVCSINASAVGCCNTVVFEEQFTIAIRVCKWWGYVMETRSDVGRDFSPVTLIWPANLSKPGAEKRRRMRKQERVTVACWQAAAATNHQLCGASGSAHWEVLGSRVYEWTISTGCLKKMWCCCRSL